MPTSFVATAGSSLGTLVFSGEVAIATALLVVTRQNWDKAAGFNLTQQKGVNRSWDKKRSEHIAKGMEHRLSTNQPLEHGAVILIDPKKRVQSAPVGRSKSVVTLTVSDKIKLPFIDRQHTIGALEIASANPQKFPALHAYVNDPNNTLTVKVIQCDEREGRKRFEILNFQPKQLSVIDKLWAATINALDCEESQQPEAYRDQLPLIVGFMAWHEIADDEKSVWHNRLMVDSGTPKSNGKQQNALSVRLLVDETAIIFRMYEAMDPGFVTMPITDQAGRLREALDAFWTAIASHLKDATGEKWTSYMTLKTPARLLVKVMAGLMRVYKDRRDKKGLRPEEAFLSEVSLHEFVTKSIPEEYIAKAVAQSQSAFSDDEYWSMYNKDYGILVDGDEKALAYMWKKLNIHAAKQWSSYINSAKTNEWRLMVLNQSRNEKKAEQVGEPVAE